MSGVDCARRARASGDDRPLGTPLDAVLAADAVDDLRATVRLLHRAYTSRGRLGWTSEAEPALLAALCLTIGLELVRRGATAMVCPVCAASLELT